MPERFVVILEVAMLERESVEEVLNRRIRPALVMDGGNIDLVEVKDNKIYVQLVGACGHCPSAMMTLQFGVERLLKEEFPELEAVITV
jgi:Fe-S cluster biogenesis protein NfuA